MTDSVEKIAGEILDRVIRMESRMVQLGDYVGANLRTKQRIAVLPSVAGASTVARVDIDSLDVSTSRILTELRQHGIKERGPVDVYCDGRRVFTLHL